MGHPRAVRCNKVVDIALPFVYPPKKWFPGLRVNGHRDVAGTSKEYADTLETKNVAPRGGVRTGD